MHLILTIIMDQNLNFEKCGVFNTRVFSLEDPKNLLLLYLLFLVLIHLKELGGIKKNYIFISSFFRI